jgi:hypothetical protein
MAALTFKVVLDRVYQLRYGGAAKQRMGDLHKRGQGYTLADLCSETPEVVESAAFAWGWCCITGENPHATPHDFRDAAEECNDDALATFIQTLTETIRSGMPKDGAAKNPTAESAPLPASNSA